MAGYPFSPLTSGHSGHANIADVQKRTSALLPMPRQPANICIHSIHVDGSAHEIRGKTILCPGGYHNYGWDWMRIRMRIFGPLELRRGVIAKPMWLRAESRGKQMRTIVIFNLGGTKINFIGEKLPDRQSIPEAPPYDWGDDILVAGRPQRNGDFKALAVNVPRLKKTYGDSGALQSFGAGIFFIFAFVFTWPAINAPHPAGRPETMLWLAAICPAILGLLCVWTAYSNWKARRMVQVAAEKRECHAPVSATFDESYSGWQVMRN